MKLERNNKYNRGKAIGLATIMISGMLLSGCGKTSVDVIEPTPTEIVEVTPIPTIVPTPTIAPTPEPTAKPTPTPVPTPDPRKAVFLEGEELEEEMAKLCIVDGEAIDLLAFYATVIFKTKDGEEKIMFVQQTAVKNQNSVDVYDLFSKEHLFTFDVENREDMWSDKTGSIYNENVYFEGAEILIRDYFLVSVIYLEDIDVVVDLDSYIKYIPQNVSSTKYSLSVNKMAEFYINLIPPAFRVKASDLNPEYAIESNKVLVK